MSMMAQLHSSRFSEEEMESLQSIYDKELAIYNSKCKPIGQRFSTLMGVAGNIDDDVTVKLPIEHAPLYINDDDPFTKAVAIWRLKIGR